MERRGLRQKAKAVKVVETIAGSGVVWKNVLKEKKQRQNSGERKE